MLNRILYWLVTLPVGAKGGILAGALLLVVWGCGNLAAIPAAYARQAAQATQTAVAQVTAVARSQQAATATAVAQVTAVAQGHLNATATTVGEMTAVAQRQVDATTTVVAEATAAAQAAADATAAVVTQIAGATTTAVVQATAEVQARQEATRRAVAGQTATAVTAAQERAAKATATKQAQAASAQATAVWKKFLGYQTQAPEGDFQGYSRTAAVACNLVYRTCVSDYSCADKNSKFIIVNLAVQNNGSSAVHVNPIDFTLVSTDQRAVTLSSDTFSLNGYLDAITIDPGTHTSGRIAFLVRKEFIPGQLVWRSFLGDPVSVTLVEAP